ncbi:MAG: hypothetical protein RBU21_19345 [FCB group bacterium]|jgi:hypothetical protein|nr:hypothetical protein [FCB group bacterium]
MVDPTALEILEREIATMMDKLETFARSQGFASLDAALAAASQADPFRIPVAIRTDIKDRAACGGFSPPETPGEWLAWILDEATLQTEQADAAQDHEERQARLKYLTLLKDTANRLIKAGVEPDKLPWRKATLKMIERWHDGLREGTERVKADVELDSYGATITVENAKGEDTSQVLVEFYDGAVTAHVWDAEDFGGDPTESVELFKVEEAAPKKEIQAEAYMAEVRNAINVTSGMHVVKEEGGVLTVSLDVLADDEGNVLYQTEATLRLEGKTLIIAGFNDTPFGKYPASGHGPQQVVTLLEELQVEIQDLLDTFDSPVSRRGG